jgi:hypothetical protein
LFAIARLSANKDAPPILDTAFVPATSALPAIVAVDTSRLMDAFFGGRNPRTLLAYRKDMENFRRFVGAASVEEAAQLLFRGSHGQANTIALTTAPPWWTGGSSLPR